MQLAQMNDAISWQSLHLNDENASVSIVNKNKDLGVKTLKYKYEIKSKFEDY